MPATPNPRVNVVVTQRQHSLLMELGALQGRSAASYLRQLLDVAEPVLRASLPPLRAAQRAKDAQPEEARRILHEALTPASEDGEQLTLTDFLLHLTSSLDDSDGPDGADRSASEDRTARTAAKRAK